MFSIEKNLGFEEKIISEPVLLYTINNINSHMLYHYFSLLQDIFIFYHQLAFETEAYDLFSPASQDAKCPEFNALLELTQHKDMTGQ